MTQDGIPSKKIPLTEKEVESLRTEVEKNPKSLNFVQLGDHYYSENNLDEAQFIFQRGLKYNPQSASGLMGLAKVFKAKNEYDIAAKHLSIAIQLSPQNWQAYLLRADIYVKVRNPVLALNDFKKVLLFNPRQAIARKAIPKLESLVSDMGLESENFQIQSLQSLPKNIDTAEKTTVSSVSTPPQLERILSLIDAFVQKQDYPRALKLLNECRVEYANHPELNERALKLSQYESAEKICPKLDNEISESKRALSVEKKQKALELLLRRISHVRNSRLVQS